MSFYCLEDKKFNPFEFDLKTIEQLLNTPDSKLDLSCFISSIKLKRNYILLKTINLIDIDFLIKMVPQKYVKTLIDLVLDLLKNDPINFNLLEVINKIIFYHKINDINLNKDFYKKVYEDLTNDFFMIDFLIKNN